MSTERALLAIVVALLLIVPADAAAQKAAIGPVKRVEQAPVVRDDKLTLRIPISIRSGVRTKDLYAEITDVNLPGRRELGLFERFSARVEGARKGRGPAVLLDVDAREALPAGRYRVRIRVRRKKPAAPRARFVVVDVDIAAATVKQPDVVKIRRTVGLGGSEEDAGATLVLRESSLRSRIVSADVTAGAAATGDGAQADGSVTQVDQAKELPPGGRIEVPVTASGEFPIGTASGKLTVDAPELAAPVEIDYQVLSERSEKVLWLLLFAGVLLGYLTKVLLARWIEKQAAKGDANEVLAKIARSAKLHPDREFQESLRTLYADLELKLDGDATALSAAAGKARTDLKDAEDALATRAAAAAGKLAAARAEVSTSWTLPPEVQAVVDKDAAHLSRLSRKLQAGRVGEVQSELDERSQAGLRAAFTRWREPAAAFVGSTATARLTAGREELRKAAGAATTAIEAVTGAKATSLEQMHTARAAVESVRTQLASVADAVAREVSEVLEAADQPTASIRAAGRALARTLEAAAGHKPEALSPINIAREALEDAIEAAVTDALRAGNGDAAQVAARLKAGDFAAAARAAVNAQAAEQAAEEVRQGGGGPRAVGRGTRPWSKGACWPGTSARPTPAGSGPVTTRPAPRKSGHTRLANSVSCSVTFGTFSWPWP